MTIYTYHKDGTLPEPAIADKFSTVFVFGSNLQGMHGGGAARAAYEMFGAKWFYGDGWVGNSYAIPTKYDYRKVVPLDIVRPYIIKFLETAQQFNNHSFFVTRVGCGLAGYQDSDIAPMFKGAPVNCDFPEEWKPYLE